MAKIVQDISILRQKSERVDSVEEAQKIIVKLEKALKETDNGVGLAAIQLGIPKRIGVIEKHNGGLLHLINPEIIESEEEFIYFNEGCLSFPGQYTNVKRYKQITVKHQRIDDNKFVDESFVAYYSKGSDEINDGLLAIAVQHEIDHFEGKLIIDSEIKIEPVQRQNDKIGRNDPCPCGSGKKYKKCCLNKG